MLSKFCLSNGSPKVYVARVLRNGGYMYVATSLQPPFAPPHQKDIVRARLHTGGYYVSPKPEGTCDGGTPAPWDRVRRARGGGEGSGGGDGSSSGGNAPTAAASAPASASDLDAAAAVMVITMLHLDLANALPRSVYAFVARRFASVMESFRKFAVKRGLTTGTR